MRKLPNKYENPFDNFLLHINEYTGPYMYNAGISPNTITSLSSITCILVIILLFQANYYLAAFFLVISYYFDCLDGHLARSYKMGTIFGDYYDHISDVLKIISILLALYIIDSTKFFKILPLYILISILMLIHLGCQELYFQKKQSPTLSFTENLCPVEDKSNINQITNTLNITKYFGCGTSYITLFIGIIYYAH